MIGDNVVRIPSSIFQLATQAARSLSWNTQWSDSTGEPLRGGVTPVLRVDKQFSGAYNFVNYEATTGITGASTFGQCRWVPARCLQRDLPGQFVRPDLQLENLVQRRRLAD
ncbi:hypothetical protein [Pseudomonas sp. H2_E05]